MGISVKKIILQLMKLLCMTLKSKCGVQQVHGQNPKFPIF